MKEYSLFLSHVNLLGCMGFFLLLISISLILLLGGLGIPSFHMLHFDGHLILNLDLILEPEGEVLAGAESLEMIKECWLVSRADLYKLGIVVDDDFFIFMGQEGGM